MRLLAIDGNSIMNRAFYGIKLLSNSAGRYTNAITGFMNIYLKETEAVKPDHVAVAFDLRAPTFRHKASAAYKANRKGMPEELAEQMPQIKALLTELGITVVTCEGYEADDILGTLSRIAENEGGECFIVTGDRDSYQLVTDKTTVRLAATKETKIYTPERIKEEYGVKPLQMIEIKALMGDSSDNISGVKGIGEKTAVSLIQQAGSVEGLYDKLDEIKLTPSVRKKLEEGRQDALDSKFLATICLEAPIDKSIEAYALHEGDRAAAAARLKELEMFKLMEKLGLHAGAAPAVSEGKKAKPHKLKKYDIKPLDADVIAALDEKKKAFFTLSGEEELTLRAVIDDTIYTCESFMGGTELILAFLTSQCEKYTFDAKKAYKLAFSNGESAENIVFSCDLAGYLLNSQAKEYTAKNLCAAYDVTYRSDMEGYESIASLPALCEGLSAKLDGNDLRKLFEGIEMPLCEVLASMEVIGVKADKEGIRAFGASLTGDIERLKNDICELAGEQFNILSPKQLGEILFSPDKLGLKGGKKTKTGYSTSAEVLEELIDKHPIIPKILEYRTLTKLMSTYVEGLIKVISPEDGRIHSYFKQTETRTGRISSTEPNLQNIPVRKEIGRNMRKFFIAEKGKTLVDADYSQIELRVLASVCGDKNMQQAFLDGTDIHTKTAASVFGLPEDFVTPEMRSAAKAVNFGIIYGIGAFSLSKDIGVSVAEAKQYIENYLKNFPKISEYMESTVEFAKQNGYVLTIFDRRRYIPELKMSNKNMQAFGRRVAMNAPIQGSAADIIKIAMINVYKRLKKDLPKARLILQIHDELIIECIEKDAQLASVILKEEMENAVKLDVPLTVDVHSGHSWFEAKE